MRKLMEHTEQVVVSMVLYAYNEQLYVREAIQSALSQTYSPLEIFLSDDGSTDGTFDIMKEMSSNYHGPHKIILYQNKCNLGIGSQLNAAIKQTKGSLVVLANADDVSSPDRIQILVKRWLATGKRASVLTSDVALIDSNSASLDRSLSTATTFKNLEDGVRKRFGGVLAAALAVRRDVFEAFGPLPDNLILEDNPLYLRATLLGERIHLSETLVSYRVHANNISQSFESAPFEEWRDRHRNRSCWQKRESVKAYLQMLRDIYAVPAESWPEIDLKRARWVAMEKLLESAILRDYYAGDYTISVGQKLGMLVRLFMLICKLTTKRMFPAIEKRNDIWHYRQIQKREKK